MLPVNTVLQGRYQVVEQIGRGGMGAVYKALDLRLRSTVALKETLVQGDLHRKAFEREAQLLAGMRHPTLPKVSDHFTEGDGQFLVMEFITGDDLGALLMRRAGPFPAVDVLRWGDAILGALEYLHSHQPPIIHRDIKPQNMKLTDRGEIILLDFGLAKGVVAQNSISVATGSIFGYTPHYAPLEQIQGAGTDPRSDLYALAATMYHLLTNTPPSDALTRAASRINEEADSLVAANLLNPEVPPAVANVLLQAMAQKPDQRFPNAVVMRAALRDPNQPVHSTVLLPDSAGQKKTGTQPMVMVASGAETQAARPGTGQLMAGSAAVMGTTIIPPGTAPASRAWIMWAGLAAVLVVVLMLGAFYVISGGSGSPVPTPPPPTSVAAGGIDKPTNVPQATSTLVSTLAPAEVLATAVVLQTSQALERTAQVSTARALVNALDGASTQTAIALTPLPTVIREAPTVTSPAEPISTPTLKPTTRSEATNTPRPTKAPTGPTNTVRPTVPTATPVPTKSNASVITTGSGSMMRGSADLGTISADQGAGGSCIIGSVKANDSSLFSSFGVQVDNRGNTRQTKENFATGTYSICGLPAGEWGVSVFMAGGVDIPGSEQGAHQVRVMVSGTPGEVFYVNFMALPAFSPPTPTPTPVIGLYDGIWRGTNSGTTTTGEYPPGRFEIEVRNNAIYRISVDGPSCPFETYPGYPSGIPLNGNGISVSGAVFNPITGANNSIVFSVSGSFISSSQASGRLSVKQNGGDCANASWNAGR